MFDGAYITQNEVYKNSVGVGSQRYIVSMIMDIQLHNTHIWRQ